METGIRDDMQLIGRLKDALLEIYPDFSLLLTFSTLHTSFSVT